MKESFLKNSALWAAVIGSAIYWLCVYALGVGMTKDIIDGLVLLFSSLVAMLWLRTVIRAFIANGGDQKWRLVFGIFLLFMSLAAQRVWIIVVGWDTTPEGIRPPWANNSPIPGYLAFWLLAAALLFISTTGEEGTIMTSRRSFYFIMALCVVCFLSGIVVSRYLATAGLF